MRIKFIKLLCKLLKVDISNLSEQSINVRKINEQLDKVQNFLDSCNNCEK